MRIWIVNQNSMSPDQTGSNRHFSLARELIQRGHEVTIIATSFNHRTHRETRLAKKQLWNTQTIDKVVFLWLRSPAYKGNTIHRAWNMVVFGWRVWWGLGLNALPKPHLIIG